MMQDYFHYISDIDRFFLEPEKHVFPGRTPSSAPFARYWAQRQS